MKRDRAQSLIEIVVGFVVIVPVVLVLIDLGVILLGVQANDTVCRNAVRAGASGDPAWAQQRAQLVVDRQNESSKGPLISKFVLIQPISLNVTRYPIARPDEETGKLSDGGGPVEGTVGVTTEVDVKPFLVHYVYGGKSPLTFRATQSCPISFTQGVTQSTP